tara:strand:- start:371 stop:1222 length:852 start_codon:yes stop_codon:yes gene_type:complete
MFFKIGYTVRPKRVNTSSELVYEEHNNEGILIEVVPSEDECTAYGFVFRASDSKCVLVENNLRLNFPKPFNDFSISRGNNFIGRNTRDNIISGANHILYSNNYSNVISGNYNSVKDLVSNSTISGTKAEATVDNSNVIGANQVGDIVGQRQLTTLMYGVETTAAGTVASYLNNLSGSLFPIPLNSTMYFHAEIIAVRFGGSSTGNNGDYASWVERGVIINKSGTVSINRERDAIKSNGHVTNWRPTAAVSGTDFVMNVRGAGNTDILWNSSIRFTELKSPVAL